MKPRRNLKGSEPSFTLIHNQMGGGSREHTAFFRKGVRTCGLSGRWASEKESELRRDVMGEWDLDEQG